MLYIITMHHETDKFLKLQDEYHQRYTAEEYVVYAGLSLLDFNCHIKLQQYGHYKNHKFFDITNVENHHWVRMNHLYTQLKEDIKKFQDDDMLLFTDADAWPVDDWTVIIRERLKYTPVVAIDRRENPEPFLDAKFKPYPHPSFFVVGAKFWDDNNLSWSLSPPQIETAGPTLLLWLKANNHQFTSLVRSNVFNLHPLYFGVYGNIIYHHGAGNRPVYDSIDIWTRKHLNPSLDLDLRYPNIPLFNKKLSDLVYNEIVNDKKFINVFLMGRDIE